MTTPLKRKLVESMVYSECGLFNKVSDPLKVQLALDCIAADNVSTKFTYLCIIQETKS